MSINLKLYFIRYSHESEKSHTRAFSDSALSYRYASNAIALVLLFTFNFR